MLDPRKSLAEQEALPLSAIAFRRYLATHRLEPVNVALESGVRYLTVWRVSQGKPVSRKHELPLRQGLLRMTGIPYTAPLLTQEDAEEMGFISGEKITPPGQR